MKEIGKTTPSLGTICDMLEIGGEISKEDICMTGRFMTDLLRYISNCKKIHRISTFC
ncbi:hypothetical protein L208DRAFT_1542533, partial [Tricholoma matsutake]